MQNNLATFTAFKAKYNGAFLSAFLDEIQWAKNLPDFQARSTQSEVEYIQLSALLTTCTDLWQALKRYIITAYPSAEQKPRLEEAGSLFYERAIAKNWDAANSLLTSAKIFIAAHSTQLEADLNMPPTFEVDFNAQVTLFSDKLTLFQQSEEEVKVGTDAKILSNNIMNKTLMEVCLDGQIIYKNNQPLKDQFTFSSVLQIVSGTGTTGFKGYIMNAPLNQPIIGATITTTPPTKTVVTNPEGFYEMIQIPNGIYTIQISAAGFQPQSISNYQVDTGITHNLSIPLQPI